MKKQLPLTHVTHWENFQQIIKDEKIKPQKCKFFKESLVYLSYARLAHKPSKKELNWFVNYPVVFYVKPAVIYKCQRFYPFDTGAVMVGRFKSTDLNSYNVMRDFSISLTGGTTPLKWVSKIYNTQEDYLHLRKPLPAQTSSRIENVLFEMYSNVGRNMEMLDYRLTTLECHSKQPISMNDVFAIHAPLELEPEIKKMKKNIPFKIFYYADKSLNGYLPLDLTQKSNEIFSSFL